VCRIPLSSGISTLAFVGTAKNAGKTTALNAMLPRAVDAGKTIGLVSIGVDGEEVDAVADLDKPRIHLPPAHWVATAADAFERSTARVEFHRQLGMATPLGEVFAAVTVDGGDVVLAGLRHRADLLEAQDMLSNCGADLVFVDGAYGRSVAADGRVADAVVLATGAVLGRSVEEVVEATRPTVERMRLQAPDAETLRELGRRALDREAPTVRAEGASRVLPEASALLGLESVRERFGDTLEALAVPGAVTDRAVDELLAFPTGERTLVVASPAAVQVGAEPWRRLMASPWRIRTLHPVRLVGLAANPTAPSGLTLERRALVEALTEAFDGISVFDAHRA